MDSRIEKLKVLGLPQQYAVRLVHGDLDTPARIKAATNKAIKALPGIGTKALAEIRELFPKQ